LYYWGSLVGGSSLQNSKCMIGVNFIGGS